MTTDYDLITTEYQRSKLQPWRRYAEGSLLFDLAGDLSGKKVLDLACGEGFYTRMIRLRGATRVVGVDLSAGMIDLARQQEASQPTGIDYRIHDVCDLALDETFDLVMAAYLLNYASSAGALLAMCQSVARHLRPGGRFVTVNNNPGYTGDGDTMRHYQFCRDKAGEYEGAPVDWRFFNDDGSFCTVTNYHLSIQTHEQALSLAGMGNITWHDPLIQPEGLEALGPDYWKLLKKHKPVIGLECQRC